MPKATETVLELDLNALRHNYHYLRSKLEPGTRFMAVVKAFGYGSDAVIVGKELEKLGADYLAVAYAQEGEALRKAGIALPVLVLHPQTGNFGKIIEYRLEPGLYSRKVLTHFLRCCMEQGLRDYPVHLKFNTGLNRLGFRPDDIDFIGERLRDSPEIRAISVFSHLAASDDLAEDAFNRAQLATYAKVAAEMTKAIGYAPWRHLLNTSGIINYPEAQYDMVRSGIGLYGFGNDAAVDSRLQPVATLKTIISQIHRVNAGESVGYNRGYYAKDTMYTATLPIGHADGIGRQYGHGTGRVCIKGKSVPIIGNVCMDMIMVDVTGVDCEEGDEVIVFGREVSAEMLASGANTISYELLTGISRRIRRVVLHERV